MQNDICNGRWIAAFPPDVSIYFQATKHHKITIYRITCLSFTVKELMINQYVEKLQSIVVLTHLNHPRSSTAGHSIERQQV